MMSGDKQIALTRGQYWLLEAVTECRIGLAGLSDEDYYTQYLNRSSHGLTLEDVSDTLRAFFRDGFLELTTRDSDKAVDISALDIKALLQSKKRDYMNREFYYGLTARGGGLWESFACPRWGLYMSDTGCALPDETGRYLSRFTALQEGTINLYLMYLNKWLVSLGKSPSEVISRAKVAPWQATYWKSFDTGCQVEVRVPEVADDLHDWGTYPSALYHKFNEWYTLHT